MVNHEEIDSYLTAMKNMPSYFMSLISFDDKQQSHINSLVDNILSDNNEIESHKKGEILENFISEVLTMHDLFEIQNNLLTSTNELDVVVRLTPSGKIYKKTFFEELIGSKTIIECKNYASKIGVTWIGKFASLLDVSNLKLGILITKNGITGRDWQDGKGLIKKIALKKNVYIIDLKLEDFRNIEGKNLLEIVNTKKDELQLDINIEQFYSIHEAEQNSEIRNSM